MRLVESRTVFMDLFDAATHLKRPSDRTPVITSFGSTLCRCHSGACL